MYPGGFQGVLLNIMSELEKEFLYFTDPMCSWCYGFGPEVDKLHQEFIETIPLAVIMGGLRPDETKPTPKKLADEISHHWQMVEKASGNPFDYSFFEKHPDFIYDTAPACKAVITAGKIDQGQILNYQNELQYQFYGQGQDPTKLETFSLVAEKIGLDKDTFETLYETPEMEEHLRQNFSISRQFGINAYPTLVIRVDQKFGLISQGYMKLDELKARMDNVVEQVEAALQKEV